MSNGHETNEKKGVLKMEGGPGFHHLNSALIPYFILKY